MRIAGIADDETWLGSSSTAGLPGYARKHTRACAHHVCTHVNTCQHTHARAHTHTRTLTSTRTRTQAQTQTHAHAHPRTHAHTQPRAHAQTRAHAHTQKHTSTSTHTHTHTRGLAVTTALCDATTTGQRAIPAAAAHTMERTGEIGQPNREASCSTLKQTGPTNKTKAQLFKK